MEYGNSNNLLITIDSRETSLYNDIIDRIVYNTIGSNTINNHNSRKNRNRNRNRKTNRNRSHNRNRSPTRNHV